MSSLHSADVTPQFFPKAASFRQTSGRVSLQAKKPVSKDRIVSTVLLLLMLASGLYGEFLARN